MNNLTVLVDGGWHMMKNLFFFEKGFRVSNSEAIKQATAHEFHETLARSFIKILNQLPFADNIILMSEGGSWRKHVEIPEPLQQQEVTYKGSRVKKEELDWNLIYKTYSKFAEGVSAAGITHSVGANIEGDDWAWYWSRKLNADGINVLIWSSDCDLKQLVQVHGTSFTAWYNDKAGLVLPDSCSWPEDLMEAMQHPPFRSEILEKLTHKIQKQAYINPDMIVINKILCGDAGDNIKPILQYEKNGRRYGFANKDYEATIKNLNINKVTDVLHEDNQLVSYICNIKRFQPYRFQSQSVERMLQYNIKLVWLNESTIPTHLQDIMSKVEYLHPDIPQIRSNFRTLMGRNNAIEDIFDGVGL